MIKNCTAYHEQDTVWEVYGQNAWTLLINHTQKFYLNHANQHTYRSFQNSMAIQVYRVQSLQAFEYRTYL